MGVSNNKQTVAADVASCASPIETCQIECLVYTGMTYTKTLGDMLELEMKKGKYCPDRKK